MAVGPRRQVLPGFGLTLGYTLTYLGLLVVIPFAALALEASHISLPRFWATVASPRAIASYKLTIATSFASAGVNAVFGVIVAWVLVRYSFPGRRVLDAFVDLPFAMPTAVGGIALTSIYSSHGWIGRYTEPLGLRIAFTPIGILMALTFIGLPFVVRTVQPVLQDLESDVEEAAASLGANRWQICWRVVAPAVFPSVLTGFTLAFARSLGEYGSVVFIAGNQPMRTEITTLLIMSKLEQFDYPGATAIASVMLAISFVLLLTINLLQGWTRRRSMATA